MINRNLRYAVRFVFLWIAMMSCTVGLSQPYDPLLTPRKHEIRAAWLATIKGLDWPTTLAVSPATVARQKKELTDMLDCLQQANVNVVLFQTRVRGNLFYPSTIETWCESLTGKGGKSPGYDPLAFAIEECHKRGMELHAWMVTIPLGSDKVQKDLEDASIVKRNPRICRKFNGNWYLNPGHPETTAYLSTLVRDLLSRYDVDGVHLDYIRYPDRPRRFPDGAEFRKYGKGQDLKQWRRDNITKIVRTLYKEVKSLKPWVKVSSAPLGKYRDTKRYPSYGWNAYHTVYQEAQLWMKEGIQDLIFPMLYYRDFHFYPFVLDWVENNNGRWVVPGLGIYFLHPSEGDWTLDEVERQLNFIRLNGADGEAFYRSRFLIDNNQGLLDKVKEAYYPTPALLPAMTWIDSIAPSAPQNAWLETSNFQHCLRWNRATDESDGGVFYNVYASSTYPVDIENPKLLLKARLQDTLWVHDVIMPEDSCLYYVVTAMDRCGNESSPRDINHPEGKKKTNNREKRFFVDEMQLKVVNPNFPQANKVSLKPLFLSVENDIITLPSDIKGTKLCITDMLGRQIAESNFSTKLRVRNLVAGCYRLYMIDREERMWEIGTFVK